MSLREHKRPISLILLAISLVLIGTGLYLWLAPHGGGVYGGRGQGFGQGLGQGLRQGGGGGQGQGSTVTYLWDGYSLRRFLKDIHLYIGLFFIAIAGLHIACNWKTMLRHLGLLGDDPRETGQPKSRKKVIEPKKAGLGE